MLEKTKHMDARRIPRCVRIYSLNLLIVNIWQRRIQYPASLQHSCDSSSRGVCAVDSSAQDRIVRFLWDPGLEGIWPWYVTYSDYKEIQSSHLEENPPTCNIGGKCTIYRISHVVRSVHSNCGRPRGDCVAWIGRTDCDGMLVSRVTRNILAGRLSVPADRRKDLPGLKLT